MTEKISRRLGRPKKSPYTRREQLRRAKQAQRARERSAGLLTVAVKLPARDALRLRAALAHPDFSDRVRELLDDTLVDITAYDNLAALCWNRHERYIGAEEAFRLYERNWRLVDRRRMKPAERALIERLAARFGNGVLNV